MRVERVDVDVWMFVDGWIRIVVDEMFEVCFEW